ALIVGEHDFAAFQSAGGDVVTTIRTVFASTLTAADALVTYEATADGFLRHMVRAIVGSLVEIGRGRETSAWIPRLLEWRYRSEGGRTAPARGLFLVNVAYGDAPPTEPWKR